jgi:acyl-CoA synthetase (NDP forming)
LPVVGDADSPALRAALPPFVGVSNPLDLTAQGLVEPDMYTRTLHALLGDARFSSILVGIIHTDRSTCAIKFPPVIRGVTGERLAKPVIVARLDEGAAGAEEYVPVLRAAGIPYFPSSERALRALARLTAARDVASSSSGAAPITLPGLAAMEGIVPEYRAKRLLSEAGLPFPKGRLANSAAEAQDAADALGYPVVLKAQAAELPHKSDAGGVILGLDNREAVAAAWDQLYANVAKARPGLELDGALVEAMGARGVELIIGARNDPDWGPVLLAGLGGVQAELLQDVRLLPHDLPEADIIAELNRLRGAALLNGFRGAPQCDVEAAASLIAKLGRVMAGEPRIAEIDLNPVILLPKGEGVVVLDALIRLNDGGM